MAGRFKGLALTFDDVLLEPAKSSVSLSVVNLETNLTKKIRLGIPIISAASDTVTEASMAIELSRLGCLGVIHRNLTIKAQAKEVGKVKSSKETDLVAAGVGVGDEGLSRAEVLIKAGVDVLVMDTAHGHHVNVLQAVSKIKKSYPKVELIVGNIATPEAASDLIKSGVDAIKVGVGAGSICKTRDVAGVGVPQFTAIEECSRIAKTHKVPVIADGGIVYPADLAKALAAGASSVMLGSLLAGTDKSPGKVFLRRGKKYKNYRGMGSFEAMMLRSNDRYFQKEVPEGVSALVPYKGSTKGVISSLVSSLKTAMGYYGAQTVPDLWKVRYRQITNAGIRESHVHSVISVQ